MTSMNEIIWREGLSSIAHKSDIVHEIYKAFERLEAPPELLSIIGSYGDTLEDSEVLKLLKEWNESGKILHERQ